MQNPLRYATATRTRLAVTAAIAAGALVALSLWLDWYIDLQSRSVGTNSLLLVIWLLSIFGVSALEALFVGDFLFPSGWRDQLMLARGARVGPAGGRGVGDDELGDADDLVSARRRFRSYTAHFSLLLVAAFVGNMTLVGELRSGVLWRIEEVQLVTGLRAENPETQLRAIRNVTRLGQEDLLVPATERLAELVDAGDEEIARAAVEAFGYVALRMRRSVDELRRTKSPQRWEKKLLDRLRQTQSDRLLKRFRHKEALRPELAGALGALGVKDALQVFGTSLWEKNPDPRTVRAIVMAAGDMGELHGLNLPLAALAEDAPDLQERGAWALGAILERYDPDVYTREPRCIPEAMDGLTRRLPKLTLRGQCAVVEALLDVRDARAAGALFALFDAAEGDPDCARAELPRPYGPPSVAATEERLRVKVLRAVAGIAGGNEDVIAWLHRRLNSEDAGPLSPQYRKELENLLDLARQAR